MKIVLDIGHSVADPGAESCCGLTEHGYWSEHARDIAAHSGGIGHMVYIVQRSDYGGTISRECVGINKLKADVVVSLHLNFAESPATGHEVIHYSGSTLGARLAQCICDRLTAALPHPNRGVKTPWHKRGDGFLRGVIPPAVIVEAGFLSSVDDVDLLKRNHRKITAAIADGIHDYALALCL